MTFGTFVGLASFLPIFFHDQYAISKVDAMRRHGFDVRAVVPLQTAPHARNLRYLRTKRDRLHHVAPSGPELNGTIRPVVDATSLLGAIREHPSRPHVVVKFAQAQAGEQDGDESDD